MGKIKYFFYLFVLFFSTTLAHSEELSVSVNKKVISEGETLYLTIQYDGDKNDVPDLTPLNDKFKVSSTSTSSNLIFINGNFSQQKQWIIGLLPLESGKIEIPSISLNNLTSKPLSIEVKPISNVAYIPDSKENTNSPYFQLEQAISNQNPYVQQQAILYVTLYDSIGIQNGSFSTDEDSKKNWIITPLTDKPNIKQDVINGKQMNIITFAYAVFPQKSGDLELPVFSFDGYYLKNLDYRFPHFDDDLDFFGFNFSSAFGQKVPVKMKTKPQTITVKPAPKLPDNSSWLPLEDLKIKASWVNSSKFLENEAATRQITLSFVGISKDMLPQIVFNDIDSVRQYPEKPMISEEILNDKIISTMTINDVFIFEKGGNITIPSKKITWFDINSEKFVNSSIPEEMIPVKGTKNKVSSFIDTSSVDDSIKEDSPNLSQLKKSDGETFDINLVFYLIVVFFVALLLGILITKKNNKRNPLKDIISSLNKRDYSSARNYIIEWAKIKYSNPDITTFADISDIAENEDLKRELTNLNKLLYSGSSVFFDVPSFIKILKKEDKKTIKNNKSADILPNLYK